MTRRPDRAVAAASVALALCGVLASAQVPTFSTRTEAVRVDVLVTDGGKPVRGLGLDDFEVVDNGVPQRIDSVSFEQIPLNVVLALDMSSSVQGPRLGHLQAAGRTLVQALAPADQGAVLTFGNAVALRQPLTSDHDRLVGALNQPSGMGDTSLVDAAFAGILLGESDAGRALLILFSDGLDTSSWLGTAPVLQTARRADVVVYAVSVNTGRTDPFLDDLTSLTGGTAYAVESTRDLSDAFLRVLDEFRQRYLIGYTPQGVSKDGWHRLEVRLKHRRGAVKSRPGYLAGTSEP